MMGLDGIIGVVSLRKDKNYRLTVNVFGDCHPLLYLVACLVLT